MQAFLPEDSILRIIITNGLSTVATPVFFIISGFLFFEKRLFSWEVEAADCEARHLVSCMVDHLRPVFHQADAHGENDNLQVYARSCFWRNSCAAVVFTISDFRASDGISAQKQGLCYGLRRCWCFIYSRAAVRYI